MTLHELLDEIYIGYHQNDAKSIKLHNYVKDVVAVLSAQNAIYEGRSIRISELSSRYDNNLDGDTFLQGSYGTNTAIKHKSYDVDADIAFIIDSETIDLKIRELIFQKLFKAFDNKYIVEKKKPCITIDFKDKYKIDVAIYTRVGDKIYFHNSITGIENVSKAKPKDLVAYFNRLYKENDTRRKVIRLIKHFIKTTTMQLEIEDCNKIPSISVNLLLCEQKMYENANEEELYQDTLSGIKYIRKYIGENGFAGPSCEELCVGNTFYKVRDLEDVKRVVDKISITLENKQYDQIVEKDVYDRIFQRNSKKIDNSFTGTLGE